MPHLLIYVTRKYFFNILCLFWSGCFRINIKSWRHVSLELHRQWCYQRFKSLIVMKGLIPSMEWVSLYGKYLTLCSTSHQSCLFIMNGNYESCKILITILSSMVLGLSHYSLSVPDSKLSLHYIVLPANRKNVVSCVEGKLKGIIYIHYLYLYELDLCFHLFGQIKAFYC